MKQFTVFKISDAVKNDIIVNIIEPSYKDEIKTNLVLKKKYAKAGLVLELLSKVFIGVSSITSFSAGIYQYQVLAFLAGAGSVVSLVFLQFSSYAFKESKVISDKLNKTLMKLNIETLPDPLTGSSDNASHQQNDSMTTNTENESKI
jgi:hypothetical protein